MSANAALQKRIHDAMQKKNRTGAGAAAPVPVATATAAPPASTKAPPAARTKVAAPVPTKASAKSPPSPVPIPAPAPAPELAPDATETHAEEEGVLSNASGFGRRAKSAAAASKKKQATASSSSNDNTAPVANDAAVVAADAAGAAAAPPSAEAEPAPTPKRRGAATAARAAAAGAVTETVPPAEEAQHEEPTKKKRAPSKKAAAAAAAAAEAGEGDADGEPVAAAASSSAKGKKGKKARGGAAAAAAPKSKRGKRKARPYEEELDKLIAAQGETDPSDRIPSVFTFYQSMEDDTNLAGPMHNLDQRLGTQLLYLENIIPRTEKGMGALAKEADSAITAAIGFSDAGHYASTEGRTLSAQYTKHTAGLSNSQAMLSLLGTRFLSFEQHRDGIIRLLANPGILEQFAGHSLEDLAKIADVIQKHGALALSADGRRRATYPIFGRMANCATVGEYTDTVAQILGNENCWEAMNRLSALFSYVAVGGQFADLNLEYGENAPEAKRRKK